VSEQIDIMVYNAFRPDHLARMLDHSKQLPRNRPIRRGKQFKKYSGGWMAGYGSRQPAGGAAADTYRAYSSMSADSVQDIDLLFNHAEVR
jgi:hypothetical protein